MVYFRQGVGRFDLTPREMPDIGKTSSSQPEASAKTTAGVSAVKSDEIIANIADVVEKAKTGKIEEAAEALDIELYRTMAASNFTKEHRPIIIEASAKAMELTSRQRSDLLDKVLQKQNLSIAQDGTPSKVIDTILGDTSFYANEKAFDHGFSGWQPVKKERSDIMSNAFIRLRRFLRPELSPDKINGIIENNFLGTGVERSFIKLLTSNDPQALAFLNAQTQYTKQFDNGRTVLAEILTRLEGNPAAHTRFEQMVNSNLDADSITPIQRTGWTSDSHGISANQPNQSKYSPQRLMGALDNLTAPEQGMVLGGATIAKVGLLTGGVGLAVSGTDPASQTAEAVEDISVQAAEELSEPGNPFQQTHLASADTAASGQFQTTPKEAVAFLQMQEAQHIGGQTI